MNGVIVKGSDGYEGVLEAVTEALTSADSAMDREDARTMATQVWPGTVLTMLLLSSSYGSAVALMPVGALPVGPGMLVWLVEVGDRP